MADLLGYQCSTCDRDYRPGEVTYTCPDDGGNLDVLLDLEAVTAATSPQRISASTDTSIWRYHPLLPVAEPERRGTALHTVGWTPLLKSERLCQELGLAQLWFKDDGRNPTASFKDRASAVVVARAAEIGAEVVVTASTGNAGAALAGMAAAANQKAVILAPKTAPQAKIAQLLVFGARVFLVDGTYDDAFDLSLEAAATFGWYCRNTGYNPFTAEGKKTAAYEICEQLTALSSGGSGRSRGARVGQAGGSLAEPRESRVQPGRSDAAVGWLNPDVVFVPVGDGNIISGLHKGFKDLHELGWIERIPRLFGVQSTGSAAVANAFHAGIEEIRPVRADTLADSISVDMPRDGLRALRAATETGGAYVVVEDSAILAAIAELGKQAALFAEPAGAAAFAGLVQAAEESLVASDETVVALITGSGLKDVPAALRAVGQAKVIEPTLDSLETAVHESS